MSFGYSIEDSAIRKHLDAIRALPPATRKTLQKAVREAGNSIASDAKRRSSWSSRIPGAISVSVRLSGSKTGAVVTVSGRKAPHARPYEGIGGGATYRHPVYGGPGWVTAATRPFLAPAARAGLPKARDAIAAAVQEAIDQTI